MSSIIKKRRGGRTYLYAATSARVEGRPRIVDQVYLGAEEINHYGEFLRELLYPFFPTGIAASSVRDHLKHFLANI